MSLPCSADYSACILSYHKKKRENVKSFSVSASVISYLAVKYLFLCSLLKCSFFFSYIHVSLKRFLFLSLESVLTDFSTINSESLLLVAQPFGCRYINYRTYFTQWFLYCFNVSCFFLKKLRPIYGKIISEVYNTPFVKIRQDRKFMIK